MNQFSLEPSPLDKTMSSPFSYRITGYPTTLQSCLGALEESEIYQEMPSSLRFVAELILDELASNIIKYGGPDWKEILFHVSFDGEVMQVAITDHGKEFNPWTQSPAVALEEPDDIEDLEIGGRGIHMLVQATDSRHYERKDGKNINFMTRSVRGCQDNLAA